MNFVSTLGSALGGGVVVTARWLTLGGTSAPQAASRPDAAPLTIGVAMLVQPENVVASLAWHLGMVVVAFPAVLLAIGVVEPNERAYARRVFGRRFVGATEGA